MKEIWRQKKFLKNTIEVPLQENSLVIALTNGFHARTPFRAKTDRSSLFFLLTQISIYYHFFFQKTKA